MNLLVRFTLLFVIVSLVVFAIGGVITFGVMKREIDAEQRRFLSERLEHTMGFLERRQPARQIVRDGFIVTPLEALRPETEIVYTDTVVVHRTLQRPEPHVKLDVIRNVGGQSYRIILFDVIFESDDINEVVIESLVKTYLILLIAFSGLGVLASYFQLRPFRRTLELIRDFRLTGDQSPAFPKTSIREFQRLNQFLDEMTRKVRSDYRLLKEFSENASHELQTPIAIIQGKLDVLMEDESLSEAQLGLVSSAQLTLKRLASLSNSLSLLTKIENQEFVDTTEVNVATVLSQILDEFSELFGLKNISLETNVISERIIVADRVLVGILFTNLINNAIKHNLEAGFVRVRLDKEALTVTNSGRPLDVPPEELFERFKKSNQSGSSLGLGLAIVRKICELYRFNVTYRNDNQEHKVTIRFD